MKIGILTLPLHTNYGGILQAYALQTVLGNMGHDVKVITEPLDGKKLTRLMKLRAFCVAIIKKLCNPKGNYQLYPWIEKQRNTRLIRQNTNQFINKYIRSRFISSVAELDKNEFDCIVVGSDQIWRRIYPFWGTIENAYLYFAKDWNIKRIAYAPSFGKDDIEEYSEREKKRCKKLIQKFDILSVREFSGIDIIKNEFGLSSIQVLDPTMLLSKEDYKKLIITEDFSKKFQGLFNYILDNSSTTDKIIMDSAKYLDKPTFKVNGFVDDLDVPIEKRIQGPLEDWLNAFNCADAVITDSFHACVFSIIFDKPFLVYANKQRGASRFESLLNCFSLGERIITNENEFDAKAYLLNKCPSVKSKVIQLREKSLEFLRRNI